jgi:hypothetical protein
VAILGLWLSTSTALPAAIVILAEIPAPTPFEPVALGRTVVLVIFFDVVDFGILVAMYL